MGGGKDVHDVVESVAQQPWCDGNVGMIGISFLANMQVFGAIEQPPHLKAIFPEGGHYDVYDTAYQGGIMWLMLRAAIDGRGGDSAMPVRKRISKTMNTLSKEEFERRIEERLNDPDIKNYPNYHQILRYPEMNLMWLDFILNPYDGPFWWGGEAPKDFSRVKIPAHFGAQWGRGWVTDGTIARFLEAKGPKRLVLRPPPPMQERPFHEFHDEIIRWYDHWFKGKDTGVMDGPPIKMFVQGIREWRYENEWPLARTKWTKFYLRSRHRLLPEPEPFDTESVPPDGFYQAPLFVTNKVQSLTYSTPTFPEDTEITGPIGLYLYSVIDTDDTNWIIRIFDVDPQGKKVQITTGWLKASQNEIDEAKSKPWAPHHPHRRSIPVKPGEMNVYAIRVYATSNVFKKGHCMELEIRSQEDPFDPLLGFLPPDAFHLNSARATFHKIYRDKSHPSHLLLPMIP
jgi:predicted acyl esterase